MSYNHSVFLFFYSLSGYFPEQNKRKNEQEKDKDSVYIYAFLITITNPQLDISIQIWKCLYKIQVKSAFEYKLTQTDSLFLINESSLLINYWTQTSSVAPLLLFPTMPHCNYCRQFVILQPDYNCYSTCARVSRHNGASSKTAQPIRFHLVPYCKCHIKSDWPRVCTPLYSASNKTSLGTA